MKPLIYAVALATGMATSLTQATDTVPIERCGVLADKVSVWIDTSGSMMQTVNDRNRSEEVHTFLNKMAQSVLPQGKVITEIYSIAPYAKVLTAEQRDIEAFQLSLEDRMPKMEMTGRMTKLGQRTMDLFSQEQENRSAIILITDGMTTPPQPSEQANSFETALASFAKANPNTCIHLISVAHSQEEQEAISKLQSPAICTKVNNLTALVEDEAQFQAFVENVLYKDCSKVQGLSLSAVHFRFDRSDLTVEGQAYLRSALKLIKTRSEQSPVTVQGWTDSTGPESYNNGLSMRRAKSVVKFLVENGCDAKQFKAQGMGESVKFDNGTRHGRAQNRRVEVIFGENDEI